MNLSKTSEKWIGDRVDCLNAWMEENVERAERAQSSAGHSRALPGIAVNKVRAGWRRGTFIAHALTHCSVTTVYH